MEQTINESPVKNKELEKKENDFDIAPQLIAIFTLILIVSCNYLGTLFPCKVQQIITDSVLVKHALGYLALVFFVVITAPEMQESNILLLTMGLYSWFILTSKTYYKIWFIVFALTGIIYILHIYQKNREKSEEAKEEDEIQDEEKQSAQKFRDEIIDGSKKSLSVSVIMFTIFGVLVYMGGKKREYGKDFEYIKFFFGKSNCRINSPPFTGYTESVKDAFRL
jgi:hypothetical protein